MVLGAWFGACAFLVAVVKALPALPEKVSRSPGGWDFPIALLGALLMLVALALLGAGIGWLVGRAKLHAKQG